MKPWKLYQRDYTRLTDIEERLKEEKTKEGVDILSIKPNDYYPIAIRHNLSLFPNNHIELMGMKEEKDIKVLNQAFLSLLSKEGCLERDILNFINQTPAYHIVGSILHDRFHFGHHETYLFKEMWLGSEYRTDYVLIGKGSGGYEFVLIEFEKPEGRITLKDGHLGEVFRKGNYQVDDWRTWMDANFQLFSDDLKSVSSTTKMPKEFSKYDPTRFHYVIVAGRRSDFSEVTYHTVRDNIQRMNIHLLHHDNLYDDSVALETAQTF